MSPISTESQMTDYISELGSLDTPLKNLSINNAAMIIGCSPNDVEDAIANGAKTLNDVKNIITRRITPFLKEF
jgi:archaellum biogenesis ATPase FlaH